MMSPEVFVLLGSVMVVLSLLGLIAAQYARHWFFTRDPRALLQLVDARSRPDRS